MARKKRPGKSGRAKPAPRKPKQPTKGAAKDAGGSPKDAECAGRWDESVFHPEVVVPPLTPLAPELDRRRRRYLSGRPIRPQGITGKEKLPDLVDDALLAYNGGRLAEGCRLFTEKMLAADVTVGMSLAGALTPAGLGQSCIVPLIEAGFVDWIVATGANMYHDIHFALKLPLHRGRPDLDDTELWKSRVTRIYDILLDYEMLYDTDRVLNQILEAPDFQKEMGTGEFYHLLGRYLDRFARQLKTSRASVLAAAWRAGVPIYTSAPGDSTIGMNLAGLELEGHGLRINPSIDVNESTAMVWGAKHAGGRHAVLIVGGGSPKNFLLQTEPQIQEVLRIPDVGQDYFLQITDARPDTGGLSGATPSEAVSWGKVNLENLPDTIVCYTDATIALPLLTHYALARHRPRKLKRLYDRRAELMKLLRETYFAHNQGSRERLQARRQGRIGKPPI